jgi:recombinational DNA repair protein RecR
MLLIYRLSIFSELGNKPHERMSFSVLRIGSRALQHWLSAMYSASVELSAISVCSLFDQCMGTPAKTMINPVRDKHE